MVEGVVPYAVDDLAKALYRKIRGEGAQWHGRGTNRAYYRRLARAELSHQALSTRETADHAELARIEDVAEWFESGDPGTNGSVLLSSSVAAEHSSDLRFLLSEIAALRGDLTVSRDDLDQLQAHFRQRDREATQAERQRDELRKALERIADEAPYRSGYCQSDVEYGPALSADEMQAVARQALANQGADQ